MCLQLHYRKERVMCGVFYVDSETVRKMANIAREINQKLAKAGDVMDIQE